MTSLTLQDVLDRAGDHAQIPVDWRGLDVTAENLISAIEDARELVNSDLSLAIARATLLREIADAHGDPLPRSQARAVLGHALNYANRFGEARTEATESARIARKACDPFAEGRARMTIVHACAREGKFAEGLAEADRARSLFEQAGDAAWVARAETNAGVLMRMNGNPERAAELFRHALSFHGHDPVAQGQIRNNLAEALLDTGRFDEAEHEFRTTCQLLATAKAWRLAAMGRGNLADLLGRQGRLAEALHEFEIARRFFERDAAVAEHGRILIEQADVLRALGETEQAEASYRKALDLVSAAGLPAERARALLGLGSLLAIEHPNEAGDVLTDAQNICSELGNQAMQAQIDLVRARALLASGHNHAACEITDRVEHAFDHTRLEWLLARAIGSEARTAAGRCVEAIDRLDDALERAKATALPIMLTELLRIRAAARMVAGDRDGALNDLRSCCAEIESTRSSLGFDRHRAALTHGRRHAYDELIGLLIESQDRTEAREAFEVAERARCRSWLEELDGGSQIKPRGQDGGDPELLTEFQRHRQALRSLYSRLDPASGTAQSAELTARIETEESAIREIEGRLLSSDLGAAFSLLPTEYEQIASVLDEHEALVAYWHAGPRLLAFVLRRDGLSIVESHLTPESMCEMVLASLFQIRRGLARTTTGRSDRRRAGADRALRSLGELIWDPIESTGVLDDITRLTIVPTGALHTVPFPAIIGPRGPLISCRDIAVLPSSELLPVLRARKPEGSYPVLAGVPDQAAPAIAEEIESLAAALPDAIRLESDKATRENLRTAGAHASLLHLACHGTHQPNAPLASALKLADCWVTARDIMELELPGSVVVLSGCDTGRMDAAFGDEVQGLTRAFVAAGASAMLTALWPAHDQSTSVLMEQIYTQASPAGLSPSTICSALAATQRSQINAGIHPAHWAHLIYVGG